MEGRRFWIPSQYLAEHSPVFANMLFGEFRESKMDEIDLPGKKIEDVLEMLRCLIPRDGFYKEVDYGNIITLIKLADEYQIQVLERRCIKFIESEAENRYRTRSRASVEAENQTIKILFMEGVQLGSKKVVRACLPLLPHFDMQELGPILDEVPHQVQAAIFHQIISQTNGHQMSGYCHQCGNHGVHVNHGQGQGLMTGVSSLKCCTNCRRCIMCNKVPLRISYAHGFSSTGIVREYCLCLASLASAELSKIGL